MTAPEFKSYLIFVACLAAALGIVNLLRPNKRWLGVGSLFLSLAAMLYLLNVPMFAIAVPCGLAAFCLFRDILARTERTPSGRKL